MHRLPDREVALKLNVLVRSRERLWPCCGVDDPGVDDLDEALATSQVVSEGGGRGRCVGSYSHFAARWFHILVSRVRRPDPAHDDLFRWRQRLRRIEPR
jgi:hypothetical protein